jgi:trans-2-enoyl-CoA reductase
VMSLGRANWAERLVLKAGALVKAPAGTDVAQLAMLKVNPATAHLMLCGPVSLSPGDWVIQNAANSGVGVNLIRLAKARGLKTANVVRREELIEPLRAIGADAVVVDGPDLAEKLAAATGGAAIKLAIDAVAGAATERLADCLADDGTVVNYGLLSGAPCQVRADQTVFKGITLTGFWLAKAMRAMSSDALAALYGELMPRLADGSLHVDVEASYPLTEVKAALAHAAREGRGGKVLLAPNGPLA